MMDSSQQSIQRSGKYTQGFVFEHGQANSEYARAVVERSCVAVVTLLQDVFAVAEKTAFQQAAGQLSLREQNRAFVRLADIVRYRPLLERALTTAVTCAYAGCVDVGTTQNNKTQIDERISALEKLRCESLDIVALLRVDDVVNQATNSNRPLLFDLSAQFALLFGNTVFGDIAAGNELKHIDCNPLSPATLVGGYVAGLMCANMDILSKKLLFEVFEREFLSKLPVLMNSVILRLEQENLSARNAVGFDDKNAGPIARVLENPSVLPLPLLQNKIDVMHKVLSLHQRFSLAKNLYELSSEDSLDSIMQLTSDAKYYLDSMEAVVLRSALNVTETQKLAEVRALIANHLNAIFSGKHMPLAVKVFLQTSWSEVLFDILVVFGEDSEAWQNAIHLQQELVASVTPVVDEDDLLIINRLIPGVVRALRKLLEESGCRLEDITTFLGELKLLHLQNMQQKLDAHAFVIWDECLLEDSVPEIEKMLDEHEKVCYAQMRGLVSQLTYN